MMEKKGMILIMEPERIVGLELKKELENKGYSVYHSHALRNVDELEEKERLKAIIVNIDKTKVEDMIYLKNNFSLSNVSFIAISSGEKNITEYEEVNFIKTFYKPFDSKKLVSAVEMHFFPEGE